MLFRMGADDRIVRDALAHGRDFTSPACRANIGVALDEPLPPGIHGRRVWVFRSRSWTRAAIERAEERFAP
jgi:hypothetical protein